MFAGFVGKGLLTAAISGEFFASPSMGQIVKTVETICEKNDEILFVVANYTGDRLNFGLAKESLGKKGFKNIEMFCFGDDISQMLSSNFQGLKHRRGLAGIDFLIKIAGSASESGKNLNEIYEILQSESAKICTISVSMTACEIPGIGASFILEQNQMELGLGIHGEPGVERIEIMTVQDVVKKMLETITKYYYDSSSKLEVHVLVNNLGSITQMELNIIKREIILQTSNSDIVLLSIQARTVMSSFNMKGFSISAYSGAKLPREECQILPVYRTNLEPFIESKELEKFYDSEEIVALNRIVDQSALIKIIKSASFALVRSKFSNSENFLNSLCVFLFSFCCFVLDLD